MRQSTLTGNHLSFSSTGFGPFHLLFIKKKSFLVLEQRSMDLIHNNFCLFFSKY